MGRGCGREKGSKGALFFFKRLRLRLLIFFKAALAHVFFLQLRLTVYG